MTYFESRTTWLFKVTRLFGVPMMVPVDDTPSPDYRLVLAIQPWKGATTVVKWLVKIARLLFGVPVIVVSNTYRRR